MYRTKTSTLLTLLTLLLLLGTALPAWAAYDFVSGSVYYKITNSANRTVEVTKKSSGYYTGTVTIPASVSYNGVTYSVTAIGDSAFYYCTGLTKVTLPNTIKSIGYQSFRSCTALTGITLPNGLTSIAQFAFAYSGIKGISLPNTVTSVSTYALYYCQSLDTVKWTTGVTSIPSACFTNAPLRTFKMPNWITSIGSNAFTGAAFTSIILPYGLKTINASAFKNSAITTALIPSSVTTMSRDAFTSCSSLTTLYCNMATPPDIDLTNAPTTCKIYVPVGKVQHYKNATGWSDRSSYIQAGAYDFNYGTDGYDASSTYHMTITSNQPVTYNGTTYAGTAKYVYHPNIETTSNSSFAPTLSETDNMCGAGKKYLMTEVGDSAFTRMSSSIASLSFNNCAMMTKIGVYAFRQAQGLTNLTLPPNLTTIGNSAMYYCNQLRSITIPNTVTSMGVNVLRDCRNLTSVTWGTGMTSIPGYTFWNCTSLASFDFPHWITSIGQQAFYNTALEQAILPYGLKTINSSAFQSCRSLSTVLVPSSVTSLNSTAFNFCDALTTIYCNMATPPSMSFNSVPTCYAYVPVGKVQQYRAAGGWNNMRVAAGAFDFCPGEYSERTPTHISVTSPYPVVYNGVTYDGKAKYVYHPMIEQTTAHTWTPSLYETNSMCGGSKRYLITEVGDSCFSFMSQTITSMDFSPCTGLTTIGREAFAGAKGLVTVTLPEGPTTIQGYAFSGCPNLEQVNVPNSVTSMGNFVMSDCPNLTSVTWGTGMTTIPYCAFLRSINLTNFKIPHWITSIESGAFQETNLRQAILPYGLLRVEDAFRYTPVATVLIPSSVNYVNGYAFDDCSSLTTIYCNMDYAPYLNFTGVPASCKLYVPVGKVQHYKTEWSSRSSYVEAGAFDYNYGANGYSSTGIYHMTITSNQPVTVGGTTYAGTAKYVYHPNIQSTTANVFTPLFAEADYMCGSGKYYIITEVGDSAFYLSSATIDSISFNRCTMLTKLGHDAFRESKVSKLTLPASVTDYSEYALYRMPNLTDLYVNNPTPVQVYHNTFLFDDQRRATLHVPTWNAANDYQNAPYWLYFYNITSDQEPLSYHISVCGTPVTSANKNNITGPGISGSVSYDPSNKMLTLNNAVLNYTGDDAISIETDSVILRIKGTDNVIGTPSSNNRPQVGIYSAYDLDIVGDNCDDSKLKIYATDAAYWNLGTTSRIYYMTLNLYTDDGSPITGPSHDMYNTTGTLTVVSSHLELYPSADYYPIGYLRDLRLGGCYIANPYSGSWDTQHSGIVDAYGNLVIGGTAVIEAGDIEYYDVAVNGVWVNSINKDNIIGRGISGSVSYREYSNTLLLDNVTLESDGTFNYGITFLTDPDSTGRPSAIFFSGYNTIGTPENPFQGGIYSRSDDMIISGAVTGNGDDYDLNTLNINASEEAVGHYALNNHTSTTTVANGIFDLNCRTAFASTEPASTTLYFNNVYTEGHCTPGYYPILGYDDMNLRYSYIAQPVDGYWLSTEYSDRNHGYLCDANGASYSGTFIIGHGDAPATSSRGDVNADGSVDPADIAALINYLLGGNVWPDGSMAPASGKANAQLKTLELTAPNIMPARADVTAIPDVNEILARELTQTTTPAPEQTAAEDHLPGQAPGKAAPAQEKLTPVVPAPGDIKPDDEI